MSARLRIVIGAALGVAAFGCGPEDQLVACNIAERQCQEDVYYALLRLRGDGFDPNVEIPPIPEKLLSGNACVSCDILASDRGRIAGPPRPPVETMPSTLISCGLTTRLLSSCRRR